MQKYFSHSRHGNNSFIIVKYSALIATSESPKCSPLMYWWTIYSTPTHELNKQTVEKSLAIAKAVSVLNSFKSPVHSFIIHHKLFK